MAGERCSNTRQPVVEKGHINTDVTFFILFFGGKKMLPETPLFWFEYDLIYCLNRFWLVEYCVLWNGERIVMEMVEIGENDHGYSQN